MIPSSSRLVSARSTGISSCTSPSTASLSERSISAPKMTRPGVVSRVSPLWRYSIGSCRPTCFASSANSTSSSDWNRCRPFSFSVLASSAAVVAVRSCSQYVRK